MPPPPALAAPQGMPPDRRRGSAFSGRAFWQEACPLESSDKVCPGRRQLWPSLPGCYRPRTQRPVRQCSCVVVHLDAVNGTAMDDMYGAALGFAWLLNPKVGDIEIELRNRRGSLSLNHF